MKRSLKYIKLKIKNEGKKGHFVSFYDRIKEINEKEKLQAYNLLEDSNYYNSSKSYKPNNENDVDEGMKFFLLFLYIYIYSHILMVIF